MTQSDPMTLRGSRCFIRLVLSQRILHHHEALLCADSAPAGFRQGSSVDGGQFSRKDGRKVGLYQVLCSMGTFELIRSSFSRSPSELLSATRETCRPYVFISNLFILSHISNRIHDSAVTARRWRRIGRDWRQISKDTR